MTFGSLPSITATTLFVVPKSIPMILPIALFLLPPAHGGRSRWRGPFTFGGRAGPSVRPQHNHRDPRVKTNADLDTRTRAASVPLPRPRGRSSAGRALRSQCRGQGFDPPRLHKQTARFWSDLSVIARQRATPLGSPCEAVAA